MNIHDAFYIEGGQRKEVIYDHEKVYFKNEDGYGKIFKYHANLVLIYPKQIFSIVTKFTPGALKRNPVINFQNQATPIIMNIKMLFLFH